MEPQAVAVLLSIGLVAAVLVTHLVRIVVTLRDISATLDVVLAAVTAIPGKVAPAAPILTSINRDLGTARNALDDLLARKTGG